MQLKNLLKVSCFAIFCFFVMPARAQNRVVTGKVTDSHDGLPMPGVSIVAKGSTIGTNTDAAGAFKLSLPASANTLVVSFIGYAKQEVDITGKTTINISLVGSATALSEVQIVSVGYGSQRKKDLTGAVSNISAKDFNQGAIINPLDQVQGKVAGLVITQGGGDPNQSASIRLRGQTSISGNQSPLFVVDGIPLDDPSQFQNIAPADIASYDVLKDASATAIYGSRGANGVIIVNTKKGSASKSTVDYNGYVGISNQSKYWDLLNTAEYLATPQAKANPQKQQGETDDTNTDWQRAIARTALTHSNNVAISGGANGFNYRASLNFQNQQGVIINSNKQQLGLRFNAEQKALNDKLDIQLGISNVNTNRSLTNYNAIGYVFNALPTIPVRNADGSFNDYGAGYNAYNPVLYLTDTYNRHNEYLTNINASINYNLLPELKIGVTGSTTRNNVQTHYFIPSFKAQNSNSMAVNSNYNNNSYKGDIHINYDKTFGKHSISVTAVAERSVFNYDYFFAAAQQLLVPQSLDNALGSGLIFPTPDSYKEQYQLSSLLGRVNYNYDNRFYATASIRRDQSSKFGANYQVGYFPAFDLAYRLKRDLVNDVEWINDLKIRAGYGQVGNANGIGDYSSLALVALGKKYYDGSGSGSYPGSYSPNQNANPYLKWETRIGRNIGLDFSLFNDRLSGDFNYYNDRTNNLLFANSVPTPPNFVSTTLSNVGSLTNKGIELALTGQIIKGEGLNWTASGNINFVKTRIANLSGTLADGTSVKTSFIEVGYAQGQGLSSTAITRFVPGYAPYVFYLPHYTGINAQGVELFDGKTVADYPGQAPPKHYIDPSPKFNYGINNSFNYKNWSLSFFLRGVYGQKVFNNTLLDYETVTRLPTTNTTRTALTNGVTSNPTQSDRWLENASYLRLDNASIGYTFKQIKGLNSLRVFVAANNLFVITKYRGLDPEVSTSGSTTGTNAQGVTTGNQSYIDADYGGYAYYPKTRTFTFGTSVSFK
ncbi:SusC/RagA family TonB-linked outer membrane protein [Mucilaginibacter sp. SP1R1]|uniref:SusC/RagA family TonB-linked outer membrane protein n=1 Tax=Mucilaginibacter sp. SP1R1 TaxID=2723091 RepID=UPI001613844A|nr:SusC/RagA family TonB-linked outer membrane protein [Mucilaginibacter sp. SP1R1]MBB6151674.1 iron complex outermembrane receptor protein [Mucilaginibacter sp. SP1R1]